MLDHAGQALEVGGEAGGVGDDAAGRVIDDVAAVGADDAAIRSRFGLWKQERLGAGWQEVPSTRDENSNELHADIRGFTRYALAAD